MSKKLSFRRCGFTLIELLVVIAIIALLVAILMPALSQARRLAEVSGCSVNLKSTGLGLHLYAADFQEFPSAFEPVHSRWENEPYQFAQWTYCGDGHFWLKLLAGGHESAREYDSNWGGKYVSPENLRCNGLGHKAPFYWDNRHSICAPAPRGDAHYDYGGPLLGAPQKWVQDASGAYTGEQELDTSKLDQKQTLWPSGYGANGNLLRDYNVRVRDKSRMIAVCATVWRADPGIWSMFEPHGGGLRVNSLTDGNYMVYNTYWRNGLFSDGHAEVRRRPESIVPSGDGRDRTNPWMPGNFSAIRQTATSP